jgi:ABC-type antimicrobial peptide transport system permease subunit
LGGLLGLAVSLAILNGMHLSIGTEGVPVNFVSSPALFARGLAIALATGALAGLAPAIRSARAPIVASLRSTT